MLVKELIAELQKLDQDAPVYNWNHEFGYPIKFDKILKQPSFKYDPNDTFEYQSGYVIK